MKYHSKIKETGYQGYDNYSAIEIPIWTAIPCDYDGVMGVPISFLDKYCPDQFEIIGITENLRKDNSNKEVAELYIEGNPKYDRPYLKGKRMFPRLLIRKKR